MVLNGIPQLYGLDGPSPRHSSSTIDYVAQGTAIGHKLGRATGAPSGAAHICADVDRAQQGSDRRLNVRPHPTNPTEQRFPRSAADLTQ